MPRTFGRNLQMCFTNFIKYPQSPQSSIQEKSQENNNQTPSDKFADFLIKNFNSLYHDPNNYITSNPTSNSKHAPSSPEYDNTDTTTPDFATVYASRRFFFSSPGLSNSIVESSVSSSSCSSSQFLPDKLSDKDNAVVDGGVPIPTFSPDPFVDFRRSMQEMVESRELVDVRANWEYLHELLTCYLSLNPKSAHKFIVGAFADLLVSLMASPPVDGGRRKTGSGRESSKKTVNL